MKNLIGSIALAATLALGQGCAATQNYREYNSVRIRSGFEAMKYAVNIGGEIQTTPTHSDDTSQPAEATARLGEHYGNGIRVGLESSYGNDDNRLGLGWDARHAFCSDGGRLEMLAEKRQEIDPQVPESYAFTRLTPDRFGHTIFIRGERKIYGNIRIGAEIGLPYSGFTVESGRDRHGKWEILEKERWSGFGKMFKLTVDAGLSKRFSLFFSAGTEEFEPEFKGEKGKIRSGVASGGLMVNF